MRSYLHLVVITSLVLLTIGLGTAFTVGGISLYMPPLEVRSLAKIYLNTTFNTNFALSPLSPEAVTAIVWDYRGLDTLFETSVMFLAIVGALMIFRGLGERVPGPGSGGGGLSLIVKTVTRLTTIMIVAVGISIAFHGHLTPGGGFQGGATIAVAPMLMIIAFSVHFLAQRVPVKRAVLLRSAGLAAIAVTTYLVLLVALTRGGYAYIFQNQPKVGAPYGIPSYVGDATVLGGTLLLFNVAEMFAVAFGFVALLILITVPEAPAKEVVLKGED
ncbi:MAG: Na(+)/H(+) antiporter subunit B [Desulfurococcaceae archaeon]